MKDRSELPLLGVLVVVVAAIGLVMGHHWRAGLVLFGIGLIGAATLRATLSDSQLGMLAVRGRMLDTLVLAVSGGTLIVLAESLSTVR
jgi:hypothetical protein